MLLTICRFDLLTLKLVSASRVSSARPSRVRVSANSCQSTHCVSTQPNARPSCTRSGIDLTRAATRAFNVACVDDGPNGAVEACDSADVLYEEQMVERIRAAELKQNWAGGIPWWSA